MVCPQYTGKLFSPPIFGFVLYGYETLKNSSVHHPFFSICLRVADLSFVLFFFFPVYPNRKIIVSVLYFFLFSPLPLWVSKQGSRQNQEGNYNPSLEKEYMQSWQKDRHLITFTERMTSPGSDARILGGSRCQANSNG